jgi:hypothetical protein
MTGRDIAAGHAAGPRRISGGAGGAIDPAGHESAGLTALRAGPEDLKHPRRYPRDPDTADQHLCGTLGTFSFRRASSSDGHRLQTGIVFIRASSVPGPTA